jgi:hypothetical protein
MVKDASMIKQGWANWKANFFPRDIRSIALKRHRINRGLQARATTNSYRRGIAARTLSIS